MRVIYVLAVGIHAAVFVQWMFHLSSPPNFIHNKKALSQECFISQDILLYCKTLYLSQNIADTC